MKLTVGSHPGLPFPFSNGPEVPQEPVKGLKDPMPLASERHANGVTALASLLNYWLGSSGMSHDQLVAIAAWGIGEAGMLDSTVISRIRNAKQTRGASLRHLDAMAAANYAIWSWKTQGPEAARTVMGPHSAWGIRDAWLDDATWLPDPEDATDPLDFAGFAGVLAGHLELPYVTQPLLSPGDASRLSTGLEHLLEGLIADKGWGPREATRELLSVYPANDSARQQRLRGVIVGSIHLSRDELDSEIYALAEMIRVVRGLKPGSYGAAQLKQELLTGRRF